MTTAGGAAPRLTLSGVRVAYGQRTVLEGLDLQVSRPVTALLGPNGAGKTTLMSVASGALRPGVGRVEAAGPVAMLPQHFTFPPRVRLAQAVAHTAWSSGADRADLPGLAARALERVGLAERSQDRVSTLSGGQRQRLGIACALGHAPAVLLLDEPSVGLDPLQRQALRDTLREVSRDTTLMLSTHLVDDVATLADDIVLLVDGQIRFHGPIEQFADAGPDPTRALEQAYVRAVGGIAS